MAEKRVIIAIDGPAGAGDPAFVIADEPTGNLDASNGEKVLQLIAYLREQTGKTFFIATHDSAVASHADRTIRIIDGRIASIEIVGQGIAQ
jgi:putative ABC transport system ATP-binding protein